MRKPYFREDTYPTVTRYSYPVKKFAGIDAYSKEEGLSLNWAKKGYNISIKNGILSKAMGISEATRDGDDDYFPNFQYNYYNISRLHFYKRYDYAKGIDDSRLFLCVENEGVFHARKGDNGYAIVAPLPVNSRLVCFCNYYYNGKDCVLAAGEREYDIVLYDGKDSIPISFQPIMSQICVHKERVFAVQKDSNLLHFSAQCDPTEWSVQSHKGGRVDLTDGNGMLRKVISFKDALYIFKDYGIYKLNVFGEQSEFSLVKIFDTNNLIHSETVVVCDDKILFLTDDGFYSLDGYNIVKILRGIFPLLSDKQYTSGCYFNQKYYLACRMDFDDKKVGDEANVSEYKNNAVFGYDTISGDVEIFRGCDVKELVPVSINGENMLYLCFNEGPRGYQVAKIDDSGRLFGEPLLSCWQSVVTDFEMLDKDKVLRRIYIKSRDNISLTAHIGNEYKFPITGKIGDNSLINVNKRAQQMGLVIESCDDNLSVRGMLLEFDLIRRFENE